MEPDIKKAHEGTQTEPLERIAMVLVHIGGHAGPLTPQAVIGLAGLEQRYVEQGQPGLPGKGLDGDILPDRSRLFLAELE